ncbi:MAG: sigma-70 family RNA polymerase sigma factor [Aphanocapsa lilacina HA4352-LM1]|nr:sigma-70 family RNA polymerase sigma factor [Aphanocapsa lilacina HA4352-LM1]
MYALVTPKESPPKSCRTHLDHFVIEAMAIQTAVVESPSAVVEDLALQLQSIQSQLRACTEAKAAAPKADLLNFLSRRKARLLEKQHAQLLAERRRIMAVLYARINPRLESYLGSQSWKFSGNQTIEDLRNEAWSLLLEKISGFDPSRGKFITWFYTYVVILVLNRVRREKMRENAQRGDIELETLPEADRGDWVSGFPPECQQVIHRTVAAMPPRLKLVVVGLFFTDPPKLQKQLALDLGITPAAIAQNKAKALEQLRQALVADGCQP